MGEELFDRLKKLAKKEGKIVFVDDKDVFVILPLDEYEMLTDDLCGEECECEGDHDDHDFDFGEEIFANNEDDKKPEDVEKEDEADKDLIKRVNEDIAKWREEQAAVKTEKPTPVVASPSEGAATSPENEKNDVLTEEERYYLEPLE